MNVELLEKIKQHILEEPKRLVMDDWTCKVDVEEGGPACGTVGCIAGWAILLRHPELIEKQIASMTGQELDMFRCPPAYARTILGITFSQSQRLFYVELWPKEDKETFMEVASKAVRAMVTARRIDRFISSDGDL